MKVKVQFFALYRERAGLSHTSLELPSGVTVARAIDEIRSQFPSLAPPEVDIVVAVNTEYADADMMLHEGDDLALIPPVSGGKGYDRDHI